MNYDKFNSYLEEYENYDINTRQYIIIKQLKDLFLAFNEMNKSFYIESKSLLNSKSIDLDKKNYNQEEFLNVILLLVCSLQDSVANFNMEMMDIADKIGVMYKEFCKNNENSFYGTPRIKE